MKLKVSERCAPLQLKRTLNFTINLSFLFCFKGWSAFTDLNTNVFYLSLSSCSFGIFCLLFALFWDEFNSFVTRNDIKPPMAADNTYNQISWGRHIFTNFCIIVFLKLKDASPDTTFLYKRLELSVLPLANSDFRTCCVRH